MTSEKGQLSSAQRIFHAGQLSSAHQNKPKFATLPKKSGTKLEFAGYRFLKNPALNWVALIEVSEVVIYSCDEPSVPFEIVSALLPA